MPIQRETSIRVRLSHEEARKLKAHAELRGITVSVFLREYIRRLGALSNGRISNR